jgi:hypothetical protein
VSRRRLASLLGRRRRRTRRVVARNRAKIGHFERGKQTLQDKKM